MSPTKTPAKVPARRRSKNTPAPTETSPLVPPLRSLLHTVRCIAQHEDALCTVLHNLRNHPENSTELAVELQTLLDELPSRDYAYDLDALLRALLPLANS